MILLVAYLSAASCLLTLILIPIMARLARRWSVLDLPGGRKLHDIPIPLSGGWAIFGAFTIVVWGHLLAAWLLRDSPPSWLPADGLKFVIRVPELAAKVLPVYAGAAAMFLLGLFDDLRGMSARARLAAQGLLAAGLAAWGFRPELTFLPSWAAAGVGLLWIVGVTNAFNLLDGLDGLSAGVALVGAGALLTILGLSNQPDWMFFLAALSGSLLGFLRFNRPPASVYLGSSGSLLTGYLMAMSTLMMTYTPPDRQNLMFPILTPVFVLAIPLYDTASVMLIRLSQKRPIALGDQSHFHHRLLRLGFSRGQAAAFIVLLSAALGLSGVGLVDADLRQTLILLAQIVILLSIVILAERAAGRPRQSPRPPEGQSPGSGA